jgi:site-specific DNA recombinase
MITPGGRALAERPVRATNVIVPGVLTHDQPQMPLAGDQQPVHALAPACGCCGRRMESAWSNGRPAYRCRHGHSSASVPGPERRKTAYVREDRILPRLPALHLLLTGPATGTRRRRARRGTDVRYRAAEDVIRYLREQQVTLIYDPAAGTLRGNGEAGQAITLKGS